VVAVPTNNPAVAVGETTAKFTPSKLITVVPEVAAFGLASAVSVGELYENMARAVPTTEVIVMRMISGRAELAGTPHETSVAAIHRELVQALKSVMVGDGSAIPRLRPSMVTNTPPLAGAFAATEFVRTGASYVNWLTDVPHWPVICARSTWAEPVPPAAVGLHRMNVEANQLTVSHMVAPSRTVGVGFTLCEKPAPLIESETPTETAALNGGA